MQRNIVIIAHDPKKNDLISFLKEREQYLFDRSFICTGRTADFIEQEKFDFSVVHLKRGSSGGYLQISEMISERKIDLVIFLMADQVVSGNHHEDIRKILDSCVETNTPLAINSASADLLLIGLIRKEQAQRAREAQNIS